MNGSMARTKGQDIPLGLFLIAQKKIASHSENVSKSNFFL